MFTFSVKYAFTHPTEEDEFLLQVASNCYKTDIYVEMPLKPTKKYTPKDGQNVRVVYLAKPIGTSSYEILIKKDSQESDAVDDDDDEEEIVFLEPSKKVAEKKQSIELLFIMSNIYKNLRTPVRVLFLVPIPGLKLHTLNQVIAEGKITVLYHMIVYNNEDMNRICGDLELRDTFSMYAYTYRGPRSLNLLSRIKQMSVFLVSEYVVQ